MDAETQERIACLAAYHSRTTHPVNGDRATEGALERRVAGQIRKRSIATSDQVASTIARLTNTAAEPMSLARPAS